MLVSSPSLEDFVAVKRLVEAIASARSGFLPIPETILPCAREADPEQPVQCFQKGFRSHSHGLVTLVSKEKLILRELHKPRHTDV